MGAQAAVRKNPGREDERIFSGRPVTWFASLGMLPVTLGLVASGFAVMMGGLIAKLGRRLVQFDPATRFSDRVG